MSVFQAADRGWARTKLVHILAELAPNEWHPLTSHWSPGFKRSWELVVSKLGTLGVLIVGRKRGKEKGERIWVGNAQSLPWPPRSSWFKMDKTKAGCHTVSQSCAEPYNSLSPAHFNVCSLRLLKRMNFGNGWIVHIGSWVGGVEDILEDNGISEEC